MNRRLNIKLPAIVQAIAILVSSQAIGAECPAPQVLEGSPRLLTAVSGSAIHFSMPRRADSLAPTAVRLSVVAREPEGRQLARAEALLQPADTAWRPALIDSQVNAARTLKLSFELQTECSDARSPVTRHQVVVEIGAGCELAAAPLLEDNATRIVWLRLADATGYEICLQQAEAATRCFRTEDQQHRLERAWSSSDVGVVTPLCKRGIGVSSVVKVR